MSSSSDKLLAIIILRYFIGLLDTNLICLLFRIDFATVKVCSGLGLLVCIILYQARHVASLGGKDKLVN